MPFRPKFESRRLLAWARALLAAIALAAVLLYPLHTTLALYVIGVYFLYASAVSVRGNPRTGMLGLLALFGDTVYFLALAGSVPAPCRGCPRCSFSSC